MVLLAGTSCTFKKEIKPGAAFDMHSRILTWDQKWLYVVTYFVEKRKDAESFNYQPWSKPVDGKPTPGSPIVFATAISKCVVKAGRLTVPPEKFFRAAGVLPDTAPEASGASKADGEGVADGIKENGDDPTRLEGWTWAKVEEERVRALQMASGLSNGLDAAHEDFYALG